MDQLLIAKLSEYCDSLIGEKRDPEPNKIKKTKGKSACKELAESSTTVDELANRSCEKKRNLNETCDFNEHDSTRSELNENRSSFQDISDNKSSTNAPDKLLDKLHNPPQVTKDGFKIVSSIPEDDSDVSDAFESDLEEEEDSSPWKNFSKIPLGVSGKEKTTEDGFKIVSDIPPDDSDVSDAFTDDGDCDDMGEDMILRRKELGEAKSLNKHMLEMIDEFGLGESILKKKESGTKENKDVKKMVSSVRNSRRRKKKKKNNGFHNNITLAAKRGPPVDVAVYDYSEKRGSNNSATGDWSASKDFSVPNTKEELERTMKKMRFEVFKLGMGGFDKEKKKETRVALAIKLGAKPPKKQHVSYKDLLVTKKREKFQEKEEREMDREMGKQNKKKPKPNPKEKKKKPRAYSSQVGRFKDGVLSLSKKDLQKIKNS
ncbi:uncharacterized protein LOC135198066 [Macrobrachium nipponense]|uniref:uncharacterized protein LOC135198066 n=1 Tax=Macrobrachium nipponense TaxID=159736 RepID=UPI0030C7A83A